MPRRTKRTKPGSDQVRLPAGVVHLQTMVAIADEGCLSYNLRSVGEVAAIVCFRFLSPLTPAGAASPARTGSQGACREPPRFASACRGSGRRSLRPRGGRL